MDSAAGYRLSHPETLHIHDTHYDLPDSTLESLQIALRTRRRGTAYRITLKGSAQSNDWGAVTRSELDLPWSHEAVETITDELIHSGINAFSVASLADAQDPVATLRNMGLVVIQERETARVIRSVSGEENTVLAELAVDCVAYHVQDLSIRLCEVEVESKSDSGLAAVSAVTGALFNQYGSVLRLWPYGKLATGKAIEALLRRDGMSSIAGDGGFVSIDAVDRLEAFLQKADQPVTTTRFVDARRAP
ncbi:MAG: CYTH domain-containing protein [Chloroflexi bacterium]|nr:CYTH domain-containing protein [Chloroflexota bacterium]MBI3734070.1 CYTH domain-containing protein [Chloroflexota bacterium]